MNPVWLMLACARQPAGPGMGGAVPARLEVADARAMAGEVRDGRYHDRQYGFSLDIPEGWVARPGPDMGLMRVSVANVPTGTRVEIWTFSGSDLSPRVREGCMWTFQGDGHFAVLDRVESVRVATCVPADPMGDRVFAYIIGLDTHVLQVEVHAPSSALIAGKDAGDTVVRGLSW